MPPRSLIILLLFSHKYAVLALQLTSKELERNPFQQMEQQLQELGDQGQIEMSQYADIISKS